MREFIRNELIGWKKWELAWMLTACAVIIGLSHYWGDGLMGIISATTGVICVVCTGKGKLSAYIFGLVNCVLYAIIAYKSRLYGETMLNVLYYIPMQFVGLKVWNSHMNEDSHEVHKRRMSGMKRLLTACLIVAATYGYGLFLRYLGDAMPFVDSFTTVSSVAAMAISVWMFAEQWWIWIAVDVFSVYMWYCDFMSGSDNMATLLMWVVYLGNAVIMLIKWEREANQERGTWQKQGVR